MDELTNDEIDLLIRAHADGNAERLNRFHALRPGHPLGKDNPWKHRNIWFLIANEGGSGNYELAAARRKIQKAAQFEGSMYPVQVSHAKQHG